MSLGDAYTLGVKLTGDTQSLRAELASGIGAVQQFATAAKSAADRAAAATTAAVSAEEQLAEAVRATAATTAKAAQAAEAAQRARTALAAAGKNASVADKEAAASAQAAAVAARSVASAARATETARRSAATAASSAAKVEVKASREASAALEEYKRRASAALAGVPSAAEDSAERTSRSLGSVGSALTRLTGGLGFALLAKQVWDTGLGFATFTQNTQLALSTLLGSDVAAKQFLATIMNFAKTTPYAFTDLTSQAQKLLSAGFNTEQIVPILTAVGDAATGMGKGVQGIDSITRALGQINTKGRLQSEELLQLSENGVNGLKILANQAGMSTLEYQKLITAGLIPADEAIAGLVEGIENGTTGVNGQTRAFTGLMEKIKGEGGITATVDAANTAFRNMSGALVEGLLPAYLSLVRVATSGMGTLKVVADTFGALPGPVRDTAIALTAVVAAHKLLNTQVRTTNALTSVGTGWRTYQANVAQALDRQIAMTGQISVTRARLSALAPVAKSAGGALLGAFGGPVGLAITGVVTAVTAFASAQSAAKAKAEELRDSLDQTTAAITEQTRALIYDEIVASDRADRITGLAERVGLSMEQVLDIATDPSSDAMAALNEKLEQNAALLDRAGGSNQRYSESSERARQQNEAIRDLLDELGRSTTNVSDEQEALRQKIAAVGTQGEDSANRIGYAYSEAGAKVRQFTEDEEKALATAGDAAFKAAQTNLGARSLNLSTEDDIVAAREKVADATDKVADAEATRDDKAGRRKVSASEKVRAEEAVADARKALQEATEDLADTEARADPVKQYREQVQAIIEESQRFAQDIQALADKGLNTADLASIIAAGPEGSADTRKALLSDDSLIGFTNDARGLIDSAAETVRNQAEISQIALQDAGAGIGSNVGLGMRIAAEEGSADTIAAIAAKLGEDPQAIYDVGTQLGQSFLAGLADAAAFSDVWKNALTPNGTPVGAGTVLKPGGYFNGGIYPGYTPGRDVGYIGVSGGEAIMRPEWTRAVGPGYVHQMNAIARTAGVGGVQAAMRRFLGGFAGGGIASAPQVVTVPYAVTNERHDPLTFTGPNYFDSAEGVRPWANRRRAGLSLAGRR